MSRKKYSLSRMNSGVQTKEEIALIQFKDRVADLLTKEDDHSLLKWLKARNYDVSKAEAMFRAIITTFYEVTSADFKHPISNVHTSGCSCRGRVQTSDHVLQECPASAYLCNRPDHWSMAYREKMKVDALLADYDPPEVLKKYMTGGTCGHDKEGSPVRVELFGLLDMKGLMYSAKKIDMEKFKLKQCEGHVQYWAEMSKTLNKRVDGLTVIFDMEGVSTKMLWRPGLQMYLHLVRVLEDNYPEMLKRMFVVNAPRIFPLLYKICRPLISEETKNKIHVLGSDFSSTLLKYIDEEELPAFLGGKKTDPDGNPRCATFICQGGEVPQEYYLKDGESAEHMEMTTVGRGDKFSVDIDVGKPGSILRWEFKTDGFDIGFGVFRSEGNETVPVVPVERVNSHMVPEDGSYTCDVTGKYTVLFDNSYSKIRDKHLLYYVDVMSIDEQDADEMVDLEGYNTKEKQ